MDGSPVGGERALSLDEAKAGLETEAGDSGSALSCCRTPKSVSMTGPTSTRLSFSFVGVMTRSRIVFNQEDEEASEEVEALEFSNSFVENK